MQKFIKIVQSEAFETVMDVVVMVCIIPLPLYILTLGS